MQHFIGPNTEEVLQHVLSDTNGPYNSIGVIRSFQIIDNADVGYVDPSSAWHAINTDFTSAPTEWFNTRKFAEDYVNVQNNDALNSNDISQLLEPSIGLESTILNYSMGILGPFGLIVGATLFDYYKNNKTTSGTEKTSLIASLGLIAGGIAGTAVSTTNLINYTSMYNSENYMTRLEGVKGLCQTTGALMLGLGAGLVIDGIYRFKNADSDEKGSKILGVAEVGLGTASSALGIMSSLGSNNWTSAAVMDTNITASYTMSVTPPIDTNILNMTTSWLGWAGLIASVSLTAINAVYRWYKNKKNNVGGGAVI